MQDKMSPLDEALYDAADRGADPTEREVRPHGSEFEGKVRRPVGMIAHRHPGALMAALLTGAMVNAVRESNIFREEPIRYTDPIKDAAHAEKVRAEIDGHQARMQAAEDKRVRKAEKLRKK